MSEVLRFYEKLDNYPSQFRPIFRLNTSVKTPDGKIRYLSNSFSLNDYPLFIECDIDHDRYKFRPTFIHEQHHENLEYTLEELFNEFEKELCPQIEFNGVPYTGDEKVGPFVGVEKHHERIKREEHIIQLAFTIDNSNTESIVMKINDNEYSIVYTDCESEYFKLKHRNFGTHIYSDFSMVIDAIRRQLNPIIVIDHKKYYGSDIYADIVKGVRQEN